MGFIYVSSDYGITWNQTSAPSSDWFSIALSSSGQYCVASQGNGGSIYVSSDYGISWTESIAPVGNWYSVVMSSNGTQIVAAQAGGDIWKASFQ